MKRTLFTEDFHNEAFLLYSEQSVFSVVQICSLLIIKYSKYHQTEVFAEKSVAIISFYRNFYLMSE